MHHLDVPQFLGLLAVMLLSAKLLGACAQAIGQPAVLGELVAGVLLGMSVGGLVDPSNDVLHLLAELGMVILLFEIGLETDLRRLVQVGGASAVVAVDARRGPQQQPRGKRADDQRAARRGRQPGQPEGQDDRVLNPLDAANHQTLVIGGLLIVAAIVGKFLAGYAPFWFAGKKHVIGVGMIPRGEALVPADPARGKTAGARGHRGSRHRVITGRTTTPGHTRCSQPSRNSFSWRR
jgi:hypothetical protein